MIFFGWVFLIDFALICWFKKISLKSTNTFSFSIFFTITASLKHHRGNRYAVLMSMCHNNSPCLKLLTTSSAGMKDSGENSDLNFHIMPKQVPIEVLTHYGDNISDNTNGALLEKNLPF